MFTACAPANAYATAIAIAFAAAYATAVADALATDPAFANVPGAPRDTVSPPPRRRGERLSQQASSGVPRGAGDGETTARGDDTRRPPRCRECFYEPCGGECACHLGVA